MKINGFQKMTVLDYPGKVACTAFTAGCNLRCPFCHNSALVTRIDPMDEIAADDILAYLKKRSGILDGIVVTGGEPLLGLGLEEFLEQVKQTGMLIKLDTNGCFPDKLRKIVDAGLADYVAVDIKNSPGRYAETVGIPGFDIAPVRDTVSFLLGGGTDYEFRTTVVRELHSLPDFFAIGRWIDGAKRYFLQSFVDSGSLIGENLHAPEKSFLAQAAEITGAFVQKVEIRGVEL